MPKCKLCGIDFKLITLSHLKSCHNMTTGDYMTMFPMITMRDPDFVKNEDTRREALSKAWWNKSREERWAIQDRLSEVHMGIPQSEESNKKRSETCRLNQSTPEYREAQSKRMSKIMEEAWKRPEYRELKSSQLSEQSKRNWAIPEYRTRIIESRRESLKKRWEDPKERQKQSRRLSEVWADPSMREEMSRRIKKLWEDPVFRREHTRIIQDSMSKAWANPEFRARRIKAASETTLALWNTPEYRNKTIFSQNRQPSLDERMVLFFLEENFPSEWEHTGALPFRGGGSKSPDFTHRHLNKVIDYDEPHWHMEVRLDDPERKVEHYKALGYDCLILYPWDLWIDANVLINKVKEFTNGK